MHKNTLLVIGGPTASGKTNLALNLAQHFDTEIISADSRQCFKELNIGVAKPNEAELNRVKHHFIDSHSITQTISAGGYETFALDTLREIFRSKEVAICVGGTGLYIKALCEGIDQMPSINPSLKQKIEQQYTTQGIEWLQTELRQKDSIGYEQIDHNNPHRLMRALLFKESTGSSITEFRTGKVKKRDFNIVKIALNPARENLYHQINLRVDIMMNAGLLEEVVTLKKYEHLPSMQTVGYKELFAYLHGECSLDFAIEKIKQHTRNYAKRQLTWFINQGNFKLTKPENAMEEILKLHHQHY